MSLCKTGYLDGSADTCSKGTKKRKDFGETHWGDKARKWASKTEITGSRWDCILEGAEPFISSDANDFVEDDEDVVDPRSLIVFD